MLDSLENQETTKDNKPVVPLKIIETVVVRNPFRETIGELLMKQWQREHEEHK